MDTVLTGDAPADREHVRALVVVGHPDPGSFNHTIAAAVADAWRGCGLEVESADLHGEMFPAVITADEARGLPSTDPQVLRHQHLLRSSTLLAVVHPNWWGAPPAIVKGWMDRVFAPGSAYAFEKGADDGAAPLGLLSGHSALIINTSNTSAEREAREFGDPLDRIWRDCLLRYCGYDAVDRRVLRIVATSGADERAQWIGDATSAARALAERVASRRRH